MWPLAHRNAFPAEAKGSKGARGCWGGLALVEAGSIYLAKQFVESPSYRAGCLPTTEVKGHSISLSTKCFIEDANEEAPFETPYPECQRNMVKTVIDG